MPQPVASHPASAATPPVNPVRYVGRDLETMADARNYARWITDAFLPFLGCDVAEVGAGCGNISRLLLKQPLRSLCAIEPSAEMYPLLREVLARDPRATAHRARLAELRPTLEARFDSILYVNVLEHIVDDAAELRDARACLRPGGHLCIFVPALPWLFSRFDGEVGHERRYRRGELRMRVESAGFEVLRLHYFDFVGIVPWLVLYRLLGRVPAKADVTLYDRVAVPVARIVERWAAPPIGKNLLCVARRR